MASIPDILTKLRDSLLGLGTRRLLALGLTGLTVFAVVAASGYMLSRPSQEILYSGLDPQDVTRMGSVLQDAGIRFDVSVSGDVVTVDVGQAARARMLLAEKGLPRSDTAGYELFDKLGSLGLTTFMQQITKVRALEGELARTISLIDGIGAARVHLALKSEGSFRGANEQATASVIIRTEDGNGSKGANSVRHLVAAAIPGLSPDQVTVMSADGTLLASPDDPASAAPEKLIGLERSVSSDIEARIARTILPYVGMENFRVSVSAKLNADRRQVNETTFDPNSRVERSVRAIKESGQSQNSATAAGVTAEQNIPVEEAANPAGDSSSEQKDRKEELTNYEISSRSVSTASDGYGIDRLSIAVVVNRASLLQDLGDSPTEEQLAARIGELEKLVGSAAGIVDSRGDTLTITTVEFRTPEDFPPADEPVGIFAGLTPYMGSLLQAGTLLLITLLVVLLGLRPAVRMIVSERFALPNLEQPALPGMPFDPAGMPVGDMSVSSAALDSFALPQLGGSPEDLLLDNLAREVSNSPKDRLAKIVELDPERAVEVLKQWLTDTADQNA